jgi:hypothetical protein
MRQARSGLTSTPSSPSVRPFFATCMHQVSSPLFPLSHLTLAPRLLSLQGAFPSLYLHPVSRPLFPSSRLTSQGAGPNFHVCVWLPLDRKVVVWRSACAKGCLAEVLHLFSLYPFNSALPPFYPLTDASPFANETARTLKTQTSRTKALLGGSEPRFSPTSSVPILSCVWQW